MSVQVFLGLGANIDPDQCLQAGVAALRQTFAKLRLSPVYQSQAVGLTGPDFLNMVVSFETSLSLHELRVWIKEIETQHGRERSLPQPSCHRLDMDVLLYGELISAADNVPRGDVLQRAYVLKPLADMAPQLVCPGTEQTMAELWQQSDLQQVLTAYVMEFDS